MSVISSIKQQQKVVMDIVDDISRENMTEQMILQIQKLRKEIVKEFDISLSSVRTNQKLLAHNNKLRERLVRLKDKTEMMKFQLSLNKNQLKDEMQQIDRLVYQHRDKSISQFYEAFKKMSKKLSSKSKQKMNQLKRSRSSVFKISEMANVSQKGQVFADIEEEEEFYRKSENEFDVPVTPLTRVLPNPSIFMEPPPPREKPPTTSGRKRSKGLQRSSTMIGLMDNMRQNPPLFGQSKKGGIERVRTAFENLPSFEPSIPFPALNGEFRRRRDSIKDRLNFQDPESRARRMSSKSTRKRTLTIDGKKKKLRVEDEMSTSKLANSLKKRVRELELRERHWRTIFHEKEDEEETVRQNEQILDEVLQSLNIEMEWNKFLKTEPDRLFHRMMRSFSYNLSVPRDSSRRNLSSSTVSLLDEDMKENEEEEEDILLGFDDEWEEGLTDDFMFGQTRQADKITQTNFLSLEDRQANDFRAMLNDIVLHPRRHGNLVRFFDLYFHMKKVYEFLQKVDIAEGVFGNSATATMFDVAKSTEEHLMESVRTRLKNRMRIEVELPEGQDGLGMDILPALPNSPQGGPLQRRYRSPPKAMIIDSNLNRKKTRRKRRAGTAIPRTRHKRWTYQKPINSPPIPTRHPIPASYHEAEKLYFLKLNQGKHLYTSPTPSRNVMPTERKERNVILGEMLLERGRMKKKKKKKLKYVTIRKNINF